MKLTGIKGVLTGMTVVGAVGFWATWGSPPLMKAIGTGGGLAVGLIASLIFLWVDTLRKPASPKDLVAGMMGPPINRSKPKPLEPQKKD
jgi:hypothetical protein